MWILIIVPFVNQNDSNQKRILGGESDKILEKV